MTEVQTSHGLATKEYVIEHDLPYWREAAEHAIAVYNGLAEKVGRPLFHAPTGQAK